MISEKVHLQTNTSDTDSDTPTAEPKAVKTTSHACTPPSNRHYSQEMTFSTNRRPLNVSQEANLPPARDQAKQLLRVKVSVKNPMNEDEVFAIPCTMGPSGTPKTVRWLMDETGRRYKDLYRKAPIIKKLILRDPDTNENETLFPEDLIENVIENKQKVFAIMQSDDFSLF
jgi:hypothetical protein